MCICFFFWDWRFSMNLFAFLLRFPLELGGSVSRKLGILYLHSKVNIIERKLSLQP